MLSTVPRTEVPVPSVFITKLKMVLPVGSVLVKCGRSPSSESNNIEMVLVPPTVQADTPAE